MAPLIRVESDPSRVPFPREPGETPLPPPDSPCPATCGVIRSNSLAFNKTLSPVSAVYSHSITQRAHTHTHICPRGFLAVFEWGGREGGEEIGGARREGSISLLALNGVSLSFSLLSRRERRSFTSHGRAGVVVTTVQNPFSLYSLF